MRRLIISSEHFSENDRVDRWPARTPYSRICRPEECPHRRSNRRRQMRNPRIVPDENPRLPQPARELIQVVDAYSARQLFLGSAKPMHRHRLAQPLRRRLEHLHRRPLPHAARERMNHRKAPRRSRTFNRRKPRARLRPETAGLRVVELNRMAPPVRKRRQKLKRQAKRANQFPKIRPIRTVPGDHRIESPQPLDHLIRRQQSHPIEPSRHDRPRRIRKPRQRNIPLRAPDLRVIGTQRFQRRQAHNEVPDRTRSNQKASQMNPQL
jgi:hypothetical protein